MSAADERLLQREIMMRLKAWPVIAIPVPNQIYWPARTDAERAVIGRVIHMMKNSGQIVPGAPDLAIFFRGGGAMVELKRPKTKTLFGSRAAGRPSDNQVEMAARAQRLGVHHAFCTSWDELAERLAEWGVER